MAVVLIVLVSWLIARSISRPLESMTAAARQFADGQLWPYMRVFLGSRSGSYHET